MNTMTVVLRALLVFAARCAIFGCDSADGARILGVFPTPSISHQVVHRALMKQLALRGHQVVVVTPDPVGGDSPANYTEIDASNTYGRFQDSNKFTSAGLTDKSPLDVFVDSFNSGHVLCEMLFDHEKIRALIGRDNVEDHFDLIFLEWLFTPGTLAFSHRFPAPVIAIASLPLWGVMYDIVGKPDNPSYVPTIGLPYTDQNRTFFQRLETLVFNLRFGWFFYNSFLPRQDAIAKRFFGQETPYIRDLMEKISMLFVTVLPGFHTPQPTVPAIVHINGLHINAPKPLPKDIQQFLDSAPKGVIYFSLGSNVRSDQLTADKRSIFLEAFAELPDYHVLWKWEADNLPGQPSNVKISKWTPQQDVLRHPKTKVFITQGGEQSTEEAIHAKVPMIGIPFFGDQAFTTTLAEEKGVAVKLKLSDISKVVLLEVLRKVIEDKSYRENMERLSAQVNDQQNTPMERAVWWTEYVLRHKGAYHLRTAAVDMPWYTYLMLDIVLFFIAVATVITAIFTVTVKFIYYQIKLSTNHKKKIN